MAKASRLPISVNIRAEDERFVHYINEATERLMHMGKWWGTFGRFNISVTAQLFTLPPRIDTIEAINVSNMPLPLRSQWFEFLSLGYGTRSETLPNGSGLNECILRTMIPTFRTLPQVSGVTQASEVIVQCDLATDVGKSVRVIGYDDNNNWVRTQVAGVWQDGEDILLAQTPGTQSTTIFSRIVDVQPPKDSEDNHSDMDGQWWMYDTTNTMIGHYEYFENSPMYKQYQIPFISEDVTTVEVMGKLAFIPVIRNSDYLIISNLSALKLGIMACKAEEEHNWAEANLLWNGGKMADGTVRIGARQVLDDELGHHMGDGQQLGINIIGAGAGFGQPVENLV